MKIRFIINPSAGKAQSSKWFESIREDFLKRTGSFDCVLTQSREDAILQTQRSLEKGYNHLVAVGGDGTLNAVVNGFFENGRLINSEAVLHVTKEGSGCDYFKAVAGTKDWKKLIEQYKPRPVDLGYIEFLKQDLKPLYFINVASVGMSAEVVADRTCGYTLATLKVLPFFKAKKMKLMFNGKEVEDGFLNIFIAKGKTAGGGLKLGGKVDLDDGNFDLTCVRHMPLLKSLSQFPKLFTGRMETDGNFIREKTTSLEVHSNHPLAVEFDGELQGTTDVRFTVHAKKILVAFPN